MGIDWSIPGCGMYEGKSLNENSIATWMQMNTMNSSQTMG
jgi:hypothetical protein